MKPLVTLLLTTRKNQHLYSFINFEILIIFAIYKPTILFRCLECTSDAIQALAAFKKSYPDHRREEVQQSIDKAVTFIEKEQASDGSWFAIHLFVILIQILPTYVISKYALSIPYCAVVPITCHS